MRKFVSIVFICALFIAGVCVAQSSSETTKNAMESMPPIIGSGLQAYKEKGPEEAIQAWLKGSALEGSKEALAQANTLRMVESFYGKFQDAEVVKTRNISGRVDVYYLVMNYERGPLFARFVIYKSRQGSILTTFDLNTKQELIIPQT